MTNAMRNLPIWSHRGQVGPDVRTAQEVLIRNGLDWRVEKRPIFLADGTEVPKYWALVRDSDGQVLNIVGHNFNPLQAAEAVDFLDTLVEQNLLVYETAGETNHGRTLFLLARFPEAFRVIGDMFHSYLFLVNHHGDGAAQLGDINQRLWCANTWRVAIKGQSNFRLTFRHSRSLQEKLEYAKQSLHLIASGQEAMIQEAETLADIAFSEERYRGLVETLVPFEDEMSKRKLANLEERRSRLWNAIRVDDLENFRWTGYGAMNAVIEAASHMGPLRQTDTWRDTRLLQVMDGHPWITKAREYILETA